MKSIYEEILTSGTEFMKSRRGSDGCALAVSGDNDILLLSSSATRMSCEKDVLSCGIVSYVAQENTAHRIVKLGDNIGSENPERSIAFKNFVMEYIHLKNIRVLIDVHVENCDILTFRTNNTENIGYNRIVLCNLWDILSAYEINDFEQDLSPFDPHGVSLCSYIAEKCGIPSIDVLIPKTLLKSDEDVVNRLLAGLVRACFSLKIEECPNPMFARTAHLLN